MILGGEKTEVGGNPPFPRVLYETLGKVPQHSHTDTEPIEPALGIVDITRVMSLEFEKI